MKFDQVKTMLGMNLTDLYAMARISYHKYLAHRLIKRVDGELEKKIKSSGHVYYELLQAEEYPSMQCIITRNEYLALPYRKQILYERFKEPTPIQRHPAEEAYRQNNRAFAEEKWREGSD